jgi:hypothetical protein
LKELAFCTLPVWLVWLGGCAHSPAGTRCTLPGQAAWAEYRSKHFVFEVARWDREPGKLVSSFEELLGAVTGSLVTEPIDLPGKVRVLVLSSRRDVEKIVGSDVIAFYWISALAEPTILISAEDVDDLPQSIAHELTHHVSYYLFPRQNRWFAEGLAQFVESVAKVDSRGRRWAGGNPNSGWAAGSVKFTPAPQLFSWGDTWLNCGLCDHDPYVTSFVLYRFLWNDRSKQFSEFQRHLSQGDSPDDAWRAAFPQWNRATGTLARLDGDLEHHRRHKRGMQFEVKIGEVDRTFTTAVASPADLHMLLLPLKLARTHRLLTKNVQRDVMEEALREDPYHPFATAALARLDGTPLLPKLQAVVAARPTDGHAWYLLAAETLDPAEREAALRRAVALWPNGALANAALAAHLATTGRASEALPFANHAVDLAPWNPDMVASLALVAVELGKCREALVLQSRAVDVSKAGGLGAGSSDDQALRRQLEKYQAHCNSSQTVSTPLAH